MSTPPSIASNRAITIEATLDYTPEALLLHLALGLYDQGLIPRTLNWTAPRNEKTIKIDLIVCIDPESCERLTGYLQSAPGISRVAPLDYDVAVARLSAAIPPGDG